MKIFGYGLFVWPDCPYLINAKDYKSYFDIDFDSV